MDNLPRSIGPYRVIAKLGQGGMARVVLALKPGPAGFRKLMVIKQLREELAGDPDFLTMFLDEARLAARLDHPNVVKTYEVGQDGDTYFIAMDYLEGQALNRVLHRIKRANIPLPIHLRILADALEGLEYAHELTDFDGSPLNVVHRDVSPQNLFVTYDGQVKLVDFGIAKAAGALALTREGVFKGKVAYMAPEQARAEKVDRRADLFAVGMMLAEALAGRRVTKGQEDIVTLHHRIEGTEPDILDLAPDTPAALARIVRRAMAFDRDDRYPDAAAFRADLVAYLESIDERVTGRDLTALLATHFAKERATLRSRIDQQVKLIEEASSRLSIPVIDVEPPPSLSGAKTPTSQTNKSMAIPEQASRDAQDRGRAFPMAAVGAAALFAAVAIGWRVTRGDPSPESRPSAGSAPVATAAPGESAEQREIVLSVSARPRDAVITLDGARLGTNPFKASLARDATLHRLLVRADGHVDDERMISFDRSHDIVIALGPVEDDDAPAAASAHRTAPRRVTATRPSLKPADEEGPATITPPKPKPSRPIDEKNPYQ
jgi:eukaryotic-like serine/threonine-protein kinase